MKAVWATRQLGELAELKGRIGWRGLTAKEYTKSGPLFLSVHSLNFGDYIDFEQAFHISGVRYDESPEIMLRKDDVLICKDGAGIGKVGIVGDLPDRATINSSLLLIRSGEAILPKFLYRCLSSPYFQEIVNSRLNGATTPHLYQRDITEFPIFLPPLAEQKRIVRILDEAFDGIATAKVNAQQNLQNARELFETVLQAIFTARGDGWLEKAFEELIETSVIGLTKSSREQGEDKAWPYVKMNNITRDNRFDFSSFTCVDATDGEVSKFMLKDGDFLFNTRNSYELVGKSCIYESESNTVVLYNNNIMRIRFESGIDARFILLAFSSKRVADKLTALKSGTTNVSAIYFNGLRSLVIPVPPIAEQKKIAAKLESVRAQTRRLESIYQQKLAALDELKKSLLHKAFSGEL